MDFELTAEQREIQMLAREFAENELAPIADELDRCAEFPHEILRKMGRHGLLGLPIPQEYAGRGADTFAYIAALEEIAKVWGALSLIMAVHTSVGSYPIYQFGTEEQKRRYLVPLAKGECVGGFAITEPRAGSDISNIQLTAEKQGDEYVLNGDKKFITSGSVAGSLIVLAVTDKDQGSRGLSTFIVERAAPGFSSRTLSKLGMRASETAELVFNDCRVPRENMLGTEGQGFKIALTALDGGRIGIGAQCVGIARAAMEASIKHAKERVQFGKPIGKYQAISFTIADMMARIDAARLLVYRAASLRDRGLRHTKEASMAKLYASEVAMWATTKCLHIHGGYGYLTDSPVERYFRDAKVTEIYEGTSEIQRMVIAANVLGK